MAGLLDMFTSPWTQDADKNAAINRGLLSAGLAMMANQSPNFGEAVGRGGLAGINAYDNAREDQAMQKRRQMLLEREQKQLQKEAEAEQRAAALQASRGKFLEGLQPMTAGGALASGGGPTAANAARIGQAQPFNPYAALQAGYSLDEIKALGDLPNIGAHEVKQYLETIGPDGQMVRQGVDKYGRTVGGGVQGYVAPQMVDLGDRKGFVTPRAGAAFNVGMSPSDRDASARGWAGVKNAQDRLALDAVGALKKDGKEAPEDARKREASDAMAIIAEARRLLPGATGSGAGALTDSALGFFGYGTGGAGAGAQLKALEGQLIAKMPKMSGPQSDKDVLLYKQMAATVGDAWQPVSVRLKALDTVERLQKDYAEGGVLKAPKTVNFSDLR